MAMHDVRVVAPKQAAQGAARQGKLACRACPPPSLALHPPFVEPTAPVFGT